MSKISIFNKDIDTSLAQQLNPVVYLPKIACPSTTVVKRAQITDFSNDLLPRFGIDRVMTQSIQEVQGEVGPAGERVFKPINDVHDAVRFVGNWAINNDAIGSYLQYPSADTTSYQEITFYGTGLNLLVGLNSTANRSVNVVIDGGSGNSVAFAGTTGSTVLNSRNYAVNMVFNVASNLTLGLHTVKITGNGISSQLISGYEVLNTNSTLQQTAGTSFLGGKRLYAAALTTSSPTSGFTNTYGTAGTKGGHVLCYQKADGTIAKDIRYTEVSANYLTSASHTNEEVIRTHHWREFGAGRADDFSTLTTASNDARAFTLDDGTTTLVCSQSQMSTANSLLINASSQFWTLTFVGTGLDIVRQDTTTGTDTYTLIVDGTSQGNLNTTGSTTARIEKLCSGLPYGTHTVKVTRTSAAAYQVGVNQFIVYGPSKPVLPSGCVELADYYTMADSVFTTNLDSQSVSNSGALLKSCIREFVYTGTWAASSPSSTIEGFTVNTSTNSSTVGLTFIGTGIVLSGTYGTAASVTIQYAAGNAALANYTGAATVGTGASAGTWTPGTSTWALTGGGGSRLQISGLTFGLHKIQITVLSQTGGFNFRSVEIITPIHAPKGNLPGDIQNTLMVGSCGLSDSRKFTSLSVKTLSSWVRASSVTSNPSTTSASFIPMPDMSCTIKTTGNPVEISFSSNVSSNATGGTTDIQIFINGVGDATSRRLFTSYAAGAVGVLANKIIVPLAAGVHNIQVYWAAAGGTSTASGDRRDFIVKEL